MATSHLLLIFSKGVQKAKFQNAKLSKKNTQKWVLEKNIKIVFQKTNGENYNAMCPHMPLETARWLCSQLGAFRDSFVLTFDLLGDDGQDVPGALVLEELDSLHGSIRSWMEANAPYIRRVQPIEDALTEGEAGMPIQAMLCGGMGRMLQAEALLTSTHDDRLAFYRTEYPGRDLCIVDILPHGCSKGSGLRQLLQRAGLTKDALMSIGDNWNDLPMLELARWPILMGNAPTALQTLARERGWPVGENHDMDAVAQAVAAHFG